jgi:UDP-3-O-[3-hydroxymyristoyl] glucosamine N-acyltransferase
MVEFSVGEIARMVGGKVIGNELLVISGINSLDAAGNGELSFFADRKYRESLRNTHASALLVAEKNDLYTGVQVVVSNPALAYAKVASLFAPPVSRYPGVSDQAVLGQKTRIGSNASVYPFVYVGEEVSIGDDVIIFPGVFVGNRVRIGDRTVIYPNVSISHACQIGNDVVIQAGTVIGSDGFGFARDGSASVRIPQMGIVQIDDNVEIGANNCIDRAALGRTWIKSGVKTDNFVHIAHNVVVGENTIVVAQVGIAGSVNIGRNVVIGPRAGFYDHVSVGDRAMVGPWCGVTKSISPGEAVSGYPNMPHRLWLKSTGLIKRLPQLNALVRRLEKRIEQIERRLEKGGRPS